MMGLAAPVALPPPAVFPEEPLQPLRVPSGLEGQTEKRAALAKAFGRVLREAHDVEAAALEGQGDAPQAPLLFNHWHG